MAAPVGPKKVNRYRVEFKIQAVKLAKHPEIQTQDVAQALDIHPFMLSKWKKDYREGRLRPAAARGWPRTLDGMSTSRAIGAVAGYAALALAIAVGIEGSMVADVQLALARMDADDSATWPSMAPQVRCFFTPAVAGAVVVAAVAVNLLLTPIDHRRTELLRHWVFLGAAYSLVASALPTRYPGLSISSLHKRSLGQGQRLQPDVKSGGKSRSGGGRRGYFSS